jgi:hypothetical protein
MPSVYLWHIEDAQAAGVVTTQIEGQDVDVTIYRATHIPIGDDCKPINHPARRTSLNVWVDLPLPQFPESFGREVYERIGQEPLWTGIYTCCQRPRFWLNVDENEELPEAPE